MANARGGLSKREYAAKQSGGKLNDSTGKVTVPAKTTTTAKPKQTFSKEQFAGMVDNANSWANLPNVAPPLQGAGPLQPGQTRASDSYKGGYSFKAPSSSKKGGSSGRKSSSVPPQQDTQSIWDKFVANLGASGSMGRGAGELANPHYTPGAQEVASTIGTGLRVAGDTAFGLDSALASGRPPLMSALDPQALRVAPGLDQSLQVDPSVQSDLGIIPDQSNIGTGNDPTNQTIIPPGAGNGGNGGNLRGGTVDITGNAVSSTPGKSGKGNDNGNSAYDQYAKAMKENQKMLEKAFNDMLGQTDQTYQGYQTDYEKALADAQQQEQQRILTQQMSYGTADSEQRQQADSRLAAELADKRSTFMRQLADKQNAAKTDIGFQRANKLSDMNTQSAQAYIDNYKYQQQLAQQDFANQISLMNARAKGNSGNNDYPVAAPTADVLQYMQDYGVSQKVAEQMVVAQYGYTNKPQTQSIWDMLNPNAGIGL